MKPGEAPGPDGVPPEATVALMKSWPRIMSSLVGGIPRTGSFPEEWKIAQLVLIPKPKKDAYRPISLLNTIAKGIETIMKIFKMNSRKKMACLTTKMVSDEEDPQ